jgi:glycosyltransferase involved in cell wall biosynthesis
MRDAIAGQTDPELTTHVPMGVAFPASPREVMSDEGRATAIAVIGGARDVPAYRAVLSGLARIVRNDTGIQVFLELAGPNSHEIWRHAQRLELLSQLSAVSDASKHRELIAQCDLVLLPEQYGEPRSIMYECMAHGVAIVAAKDPLVDGLEHGESAVVLDQPNADAWAREINRLLTDRDAARGLAESAREYARRHHRSSDQVERLVRMMHRVAHSGNIPIEGE